MQRQVAILLILKYFLGFSVSSPIIKLFHYTVGIFSVLKNDTKYVHFYFTHVKIFAILIYRALTVFYGAQPVSNTERRIGAF